MSDERIYNNYLTETQKLAYEDLKDMFKKREMKRKLDLSKYNKTPSENFVIASINNFIFISIIIYTF